MKKLLPLAMLFLLGCYAPLNNSGVSTNKAWLEIPAKKTGFDGKQYDSCYQFKVHFVPAQASTALVGQQSCIDTCCWRSDQEEVVWNLNKDFEQNFRFYGRAEKYTPGVITLKVTHSDLMNLTAVQVSPRGAIGRDGTVKLKHETVENPARLAQIQSQARRLQTQHNAARADAAIEEEFSDENIGAVLAADPALARSRQLVQQRVGTQIDTYFYHINQRYREKGYMFILGERRYVSRPISVDTYRVVCRAAVQTGTSNEQLQKRMLSCGTWQVDMTTQAVSPADGRARQIKAM